MFHKLDDLERKFNELSDRIADPAVIGNTAQFQKMAKERANLESLVHAYQHYKKVVAEIDDNKTLLNETDEDMRKMAKEELVRLEPEKEIIEAELKILLLPKDPNDEKNIILEIRAGTGDDEAALFVSDLYRMYSRFADNRGWRDAARSLYIPGHACRTARRETAFVRLAPAAGWSCLLRGSGRNL